MPSIQLHEPGATAPPFEPGRLYSMLDILGGCKATCDRCGRWSRTAGMGSEDIRAKLAAAGWSFPDGKDVCPVCTKAEAY